MVNNIVVAIIKAGDMPIVQDGVFQIQISNISLKKHCSKRIREWQVKTGP
jgi:hypothetical protein